MSEFIKNIRFPRPSPAANRIVTGKFMQEYETWSLRLAARRREFASVHTFAFEPLSPMPFAAGQYVHLAAVPDKWVKPMVRHMSIASPPGGLVEFSMDLASGTDYKRAMGALKIGDRVAAFKLKGDFIVPEGSSGPLVFIAGGLGITPIRSILLDRKPGESHVPCALIHVARDAHLFSEELGGLNFPQWRTDRKGLDALWPMVLELGGAEGKYYICGSERFILGIQARLLEAGVTSERIVIENFR